MSASIEKPVKALAVALCLLVAAETAAQIRAHVKYGMSVINAIPGQETYWYNKELGLKLLRPSARIAGTNATIITNTLGLRSPEISPQRVPNSLRIAVVGASSVMGTYTPVNEETFSYVLQSQLRAQYPGRLVEVINAGIAGNTLADEKRMVERVLFPLRPDLIILYTGFNNISGYCRDGSGDRIAASENHALHSIHLPKWALSYELLVKNSLFIRDTKTKQKTQLALENLDLRPYASDFEAIVKTVTDRGIRLLVLTNARSFRPDMPRGQQMRLSVTARYYNRCFDLPTLHHVYDAHNEVIERIAGRFKVPVLPLHKIMPGGRTYFSDATHFSVRGEAFVAETIKQFLSDRILGDI